MICGVKEGDRRGWNKNASPREWRAEFSSRQLNRFGACHSATSVGCCCSMSPASIDHLSSHTELLTKRCVDYLEEPGDDFWYFLGELWAPQGKCLKSPIIFRTSQTSLRPISTKLGSSSKPSRLINIDGRRKNMHFEDFGMNSPFKKKPVWTYLHFRVPQILKQTLPETRATVAPLILTGILWYRNV